MLILKINLSHVLYFSWLAFCDYHRAEIKSLRSVCSNVTWHQHVIRATVHFYCVGGSENVKLCDENVYCLLHMKCNYNSWNKVSHSLTWLRLDGAEATQLDRTRKVFFISMKVIQIVVWDHLVQANLFVCTVFFKFFFSKWQPDKLMQLLGLKLPLGQGELSSCMWDGMLSIKNLKPYFPPFWRLFCNFSRTPYRYTDPSALAQLITTVINPRLKWM